VLTLRSEEKVKLPTLETGISTRKRSLSRDVLQKGFTLWELLIVVAIVAITVSMVQLSVGLSDETRDLKSAGKSLGKLFHLLSQEAVFESRNFAVSVQDQGFIVLEYNEGEWARSEQSFFGKIRLTESQRSELIIEDQIIDISTKTQPDPHILILSSGEMTPFEWRISDRLTQSSIVLQGNVLGAVLMTGPEPLE
jgi:general secretion pathway protein H